MNAIATDLDLPLSSLAGPAWVTLALFIVYYAFMTNVLRVKIKLGREHRIQGESFDRYASQDPRLLAADRTQLNLLEHMPVFLVLLWMHAFIVSAGEATILGSIYVGTRALYPFVLGRTLGRDIPQRILWVTFTGYLVLIALGFRIVLYL